MDNQEIQDDSLFYCDIEHNDNTKCFIDPLKEYSKNYSKQVYVLEKALGTGKDYSYDIKDVAIVVVPKHPILILNYGSASEEDLTEFKYDLKEDLGYLADKFHYNTILGRVRKWPENYIITNNVQEWDVTKYLSNELDDVRKIDLLISLLIGSINSIDRIGTSEPISLLDKVKRKIILFDGQQSRFIYQTLEQKKISIQGLAGTGKTELLLHKLKDVYSKEKDSKIAFTCFNKVLANDMKYRIPNFFNFLKVEEQIDWENRLHVFSSWGSISNKNSGLYRYVCAEYNLPFYTYTDNPKFDELCKMCLEELEQKDDFEPCFDYIFIDESQDFSENFFSLCEKIANKKVYVAGDIFQNIYDRNINTNIRPDFLLNKCYRTDPKTLMFAHAVGMGLYEKPHLNWLDKSGWESCGYTVEKSINDENIILSRKPLRRFEDIEATNTIRLTLCSKGNYCHKIIESVDDIKRENPSVEPDDIAVVILGDYQKLCLIADNTSYMLQQQYGWNTSKGYETKEKEVGKVYISNVNNIKGLEFPFVICVAPQMISDNIRFRNSIYMTLTRSFLTSYFIIDECNSNFNELYSSAISDIYKYGKMKVYEPTEDEQKIMDTKIEINLSHKKSIDEIVNEIINFEYPQASLEIRNWTIKSMKKFYKELSEDQVRKKVRALMEDFLEAYK